MIRVGGRNNADKRVGEKMHPILISKTPVQMLPNIHMTLPMIALGKFVSIET
jgi:hypothetical protein